MTIKTKTQNPTMYIMFPPLAVFSMTPIFFIVPSNRSCALENVLPCGQGNGRGKGEGVEDGRAGRDGTKVGQ